MGRERFNFLSEREWEAQITAKVHAFFFFFLFSFFGRAAQVGGILVPQTGIEPGPSAVKAWSPNHWTARELLFHFLI